MEITRARFNAGDKAPDWLLTAEPMGPQAVKGDIEFCVPCDVLEFEDHYMVFPALLGQIDQVMWTTGQGCRIVAPGKRVHVALGTLAVQNDIFGTFRSGAMFGQKAAEPSAEKLGGQGLLGKLSVVQQQFLGGVGVVLLWIFVGLLLGLVVTHWRTLGEASTSLLNLPKHSSHVILLGRL